MNPTNKTLVISVGGSAEPVLLSIQEKTPTHLFFFCSEKSELEIDEILKKYKSSLASQGILSPDSITAKIFSTKSAEDFSSCFQTVQEIFDSLESQPETFPKEDTIIDYTGGTKVMTSTLVLGAVLKNYDKLSYISGTDRDKKGLGIVISGSEIPLISENPVRKQGHFELQKYKEVFNNFDYHSAELIAKNAEKSPWIEDKQTFKFLQNIASYFHHRDLFDFTKAKDALLEKQPKESYNSFNLQNPLHQFMQSAYDSLSQNQELESIISHLNSLQKPFKSGNKPEKIQLNTVLVLQELYANAERRAYQGKYDDAMFRLYRLFEMFAQFRLLTKYKIHNSFVTDSDIPKSLWDAGFQKCKNRDGYYKLGSEESYRLLAEFNDPIARKLDKNFHDPKSAEYEKSLKKIGFSRNNSILAHGFSRIKESTYSGLKKLIFDLEILPQGESETLKFPDNW